MVILSKSAVTTSAIPIPLPVSITGQPIDIAITGQPISVTETASALDNALYNRTVSGSGADVTVATPSANTTLRLWQISVELDDEDITLDVFWTDSGGGTPRFITRFSTRDRSGDFFEFNQFLDIGLLNTHGADGLLRVNKTGGGTMTVDVIYTEE